MQFPLKDFTVQYISSSYQDVVQRYNYNANTTFLLDGLGTTILSIPLNTQSVLLYSEQTASMIVASASMSDFSILSDTSSLSVESISSSYSITSSFSNTATTSSWAVNSSWSPNQGATTLYTGSTYQITSSNAISSSYTLNSTNTISSSYTVSSSYSLNSTNAISTSVSISSSFSTTVNTSSYPWFQTGSNIAYMGGNVGIGTTNPSGKMHVESSGNNLILSRGGAGHTATFSISGVSDTDLIISPIGNTVFDFGNVGIGTTNPEAKLQIGSILNSSELIGSVPVLRILGGEQSPATQSILRLVRPESGDLYFGGSVDFNVYSYGIGGSPYSPKTQLDISLKSVESYIETADVTVMSLRDNGNVGIGTTAPGSNLSVKSGVSIGNSYTASLAPVDGLIVSGAVGIGTPSPDYKLKILSIYPADFAKFVSSGDSGIIFGLDITSGLPKIQGDNDTSPGRLLINPDGGNVGIRTINPHLTFQVDGAIGFAATTSGTQTGILRLGTLSDLASGSAAVLDFGSNGPSGSWLQSVLSNNLSINYPLLLNPNGGNVGIGTTLPTAKLHISGSAVNETLLNVVGVSNSSKLFVSSSGNVGIGTITPVNKLDIVGNISCSAISTSFFDYKGGTTGSTAPVTLDGYFKMTIGNQERWVPFYTSP